jgi:hypothetical protein
MALTITGAVSVATSDHFQIRTMLWAALGCNLAWGIIDGGMYLMARLGERGRNAVVARAVRKTSNRDAHRIIADELPSLLGSIFQPAQLEFIRERINQMPVSELRPGLTGRDWLGAFGVCILVVLSTFPVVIPFIVFGDARLALRTSNALAVVLLFICGFLFARHAGLWPWTTGVIMVAIGAALECCNSPWRIMLVANGEIPSTQISDRGYFFPRRLNGERYEGVPSFKPVPRIELRIGP